MDSVIDVDKKYEIVAYLLLFTTALIWGGTWPLGRWLVSEEVGGETIPPMMIATIRYFIVIWFFFLILKWREGTLNFMFMKEHYKILLFMGVTSATIYQAGYLIGEYYTSASDASIIVSCQPMIVVILSTVVLRMEKFGLRKMFGVIIAFVGIMLIFGFSPNVNVPDRLLGNLLIFIAAISYSIYIVTSRKFLNNYKTSSYQPSSLYIVTWASFFGFITTYPIALLLNPEYLNPLLYFQVPERIWLGIAYLAFLSTIVGYWFYLEGVKRLSASRAVIFQNLVPIFGVILSTILLGEIFDPIIHLTSIILILSGITLVNWEKK
jgi:drug/metabolite transporter (DMT)-like permease